MTKPKKLKSTKTEALVNWLGEVEHFLRHLEEEKKAELEEMEATMFVEKILDFGAMEGDETTGASNDENTPTVELFEKHAEIADPDSPNQELSENVIESRKDALMAEKQDLFCPIPYQRNLLDEFQPQRLANGNIKRSPIRDVNGNSGKPLAGCLEAKLQECKMKVADLEPMFKTGPEM